MSAQPTAYPDVVTREEWLGARTKLLAREREATHLRDAVNAERRRLPMVKIEKDYVFDGPDGAVSLLDMFEGRNQLYIHHFMWIDAIDAGCPSCTAGLSPLGWWEFGDGAEVGGDVQAVSVPVLGWAIA